VYRFLATGEDTNGKYTLWEAIVPPGGGPPPHVHSREEEGFFVLEGEITLQVGDERTVATAGTFANLPVRTLHSFKNESRRPAKLRISVAPAGLEQIFFEFGVPAPREPRPPRRRRGKRSKSCWRSPLGTGSRLDCPSTDSGRGTP
jgi:mannose-6-phosphate isomerase-like protein (cupin superfamily)